MATLPQPSLEELLNGTPRTKLLQPCSDEHLCALALSIPDWKELLSFLRLDKTAKNVIEEQYGSAKRRRVAVLRGWRLKHGRKATYLKLSEALKNCGWSGLVEKLCRMISGCDSEPSSEDEEDNEGPPQTIPRFPNAYNMIRHWFEPNADEHVLLILLAESWQEMLNLPCKEEHILHLAPSIADWKELAPYLGLRDADEKEIEEENTSTGQRRLATLMTWKHKNRSRATYGALCRALRRIGNSDLVEQLQDICIASEDTNDRESREPSPMCQISSSPALPQLAVQASPTGNAHSQSNQSCVIPPGVQPITFCAPDHFECVERLFHQLALSGHSDSVAEKAQALVQSAEIDSSVKVLALGFQALECIHGLNHPDSALNILDQAMMLIRTKMDCNNAIIMKARILRHCTIAFRKQNRLEFALEHVERAKELYLTVQAPPYDYANLICEHAAILELLHKDNMSTTVEEEIGKLWEIGARHIVLSKAYQSPSVVFVIRACQAMFFMKAWSGIPQSDLPEPSLRDLRKADQCLQECKEFVKIHHPSAYKVKFNIAYSFLRFWQGNFTEAISYTKAAIRHYKDCQRIDEGKLAQMDERLRWLQLLASHHPLETANDVLIQVLS